MTDIQLHHGNCLDILPTLPDCSVDSIVTDPPYELGFMGKKWDNSGIAYNPDLWQECLRVLKPGGHLLAFGGTRTYHRMAVAIEDAGFEIRDSLHWIYGSWFPKSLDVSKAIDKTNGEPDRLVKFVKWMKTTGLRAKKINDIIGKADVGSHYLRLDQPAIPTAKLWALLRPHVAEVPGWVDELVARIEAEREVIGSKMTGIANKDEGPRHTIGASKAIEVDITAPATDAAKEWSGWGTALKPAHEPIVVARRPLVGTVAGNVLQWGTGAINIKGTRVGTEVRVNQPGSTNPRTSMGDGWRNDAEPTIAAGRWPANIVFTHNHDCADVCTEGCPVRELDRQQEDVSRFFTVTEWDAPFRYVAKPGKRERNAGLNHLPEKAAGVKNSSGRGFSESDPHKEITMQNHHPTVKPLALMRWLVRLVTSPGGTVLEPFAGSGTTLVACHLEGFNAIGIEMTDEYLPIIEGRLEWARQQLTELDDPQQELEL